MASAEGGHTALTCDSVNTEQGRGEPQGWGTRVDRGRGTGHGHLGGVGSTFVGQCQKLYIVPCYIQYKAYIYYIEMRIYRGYILVDRE